MIYSNQSPRYLPHLNDPGILRMGLNPAQPAQWIEFDDDLPHYLAHKEAMRLRHGDRVYRAEIESVPAQKELYRLLDKHLQEHHAGRHDPLEADRQPRKPLDIETLWQASLWIADDLVIMEQRGEEYCLTAASLCSPSHWNLDDKFGRPMREIHNPIPGFHQTLTPSIDRFFRHLKAERPVVRFNWSLQADNDLAHFTGEGTRATRDAKLYYRSERQSLVRLPKTSAIAFTIRVYLHPLDSLLQVEGAMPALLEAVDATPAPLAKYKGFDRLTDALLPYRDEATLRPNCESG